MCVWRRRILLKAKGLETGQGRRDFFVPNPEFSLGVHTWEFFSLGVFCKNLLKSHILSLVCVKSCLHRGLFHPNGCVEPQSVKCHYGQQKDPSMGTGVLAGMPVAFTSRLEIVTRTSEFLHCPGVVHISLEKSLNGFGYLLSRLC